MKNIAIIGSGSFGCSLAYVLNKKNRVRIWSYTKEEKDYINKKHKCLKNKNIKLDKELICFDNMKDVLNDSDYIILVSPSKTIRNICKEIKKYYNNEEIIIASKGIENDKLLSNIVEEELSNKISIITGPSYPLDIIHDKDIYLEYSGNKDIKELFNKTHINLNYNKDFIGLELGGAFKNIVSIMIGLVEGLNKNNLISYVVVESLREIQEIGKKLNAKEDTFDNISCLGEIIGAIYSSESRNKKAGLLLSKNMKKEEIEKKINMVVEGFSTLDSCKYIIDKYKLDLPLINKLYEIVYENKSPSTFI